jgi:hypothetical protein
MRERGAMNEIPFGFCQCGCGEETTISPSTDRSHGYVAGMPRRYKLGHQTGLPQISVDRDMGYITECAIWAGGMSGKYGWARGGRHAHIVAYERVRGPIPKGLVVHHLCHQPACVRVEHMQLVTLQEHRYLHPEARRPSKLSREQIDEIRGSPLSLSHLAKEYGISRTHASRIRSGKIMSP